MQESGINFMIIILRISIWGFSILPVCHSYPSSGWKTKWLRDDRARSGKINFKYLQDSPHAIMRKRFHWFDADNNCRIKFGTQLAVLDTKEKAEKLSKALLGISVWNKTKSDFLFAVEKYEWGLNRKYWVGLTDMTHEGIWEWKTTDTVTQRLPLSYTFWYQNQPDHLLPLIINGKKKRRVMEHCVSLWNPGFYKNEMHSFNDEPCSSKLYSICDLPPGGVPRG